MLSTEAYANMSEVERLEYHIAEATRDLKEFDNRLLTAEFVIETYSKHGVTLPDLVCQRLLNTDHFHRSVLANRLTFSQILLNTLRGK